MLLKGQSLEQKIITNFLTPLFSISQPFTIIAIRQHCAMYIENLTDM